MCGIVGIIYKNVLLHLFEGLKQLQNRGYDSAGIAYFSNEFNLQQRDKETNFIVEKFASTQEETALVKLKPHIDMCSNNNIYCGIAHTRWATHGGKTDNNSHPHVSYDNKFIIAHNGIIENYQDIKKKLEQDISNINFHSETDTEVIVNLIAYIYQNQEDNNKNVSKAIKDACEQLEGTWALLIMCTDYPNNLYCTRHGSPILIGHSESCVYVVSKQSAFNSKIKDYIVLNNNDICHIFIDDTNNVKMNTDEIYKSHKLSYNKQDMSCEPFDHFMEKEIMEQIDSSLRAISLGGRLLYNDQVKLGGLESHYEQLINIKNIIILGCGTSYYAGMLGMEYFKQLSNFDNILLFDGAEFNIKDVPKNGSTGLILLSQSGETKDLHRCIQIGRQNDLFLIGIVNVVDSLIAREVDCGVYLNAGREVGVASTKSFTSQVIILSLMALWFAQKRNINLNSRRKHINDLRNLHTQIEKILNKFYNKMDDYLELFNKFSSCFILGKGKACPIAMEGALKIKEVSYIHAEGYNASSLKHGPLALLEKGFPVILLNTSIYDSSKIHNSYREIKSREASVLYITYENENDVNFLQHDDRIISLNIHSENNYSELLSIIPIQLLSYYLSIKNGYNPDMPRNLAKVVTVE